jgi:aspartate/methionine/tyrosine aminotransferase
VLTASTSEAYSWLLTLVADPGDCVAVPAPGYPLVEPLARLAGVRTVAYPSHYLHPHGWEMDMLALTDVLTVTQARAVVAVNPGNPTGAYLAHGERAAVVAAAQAAGAAIIADEVFGPFVLDAVSGTPVEGGETRHPVTLAGEEAVLTFTLGGLSKLLCTPQLKLGWIRVSGPPADVARASDALDTIADAYLSVGTPVALALPELLALSDESVAATRERLRTNLATARAELDGNGWRVRRCDGGWTVLVDAPPVLPRGSDLAEHLIREAHLAVHPGWFYDLSDPRALALSLLARPDSFAEGCRRLLAAI